MATPVSQCRKFFMGVGKLQVSQGFEAGKAPCEHFNTLLFILQVNPILYYCLSELNKKKEIFAFCLTHIITQ